MANKRKIRLTRNQIRWGITEDEAPDVVWSNLMGGFYFMPSRKWHDPTSNLLVLWGPKADGFEWTTTSLQITNVGSNRWRVAREIAAWAT